MGRWGILKYNNTSEINPLDYILGQERAVEAMELGLKINNPAYNIYIAGEPGTGKSTYALKVLNEYASKKIRIKIGVIYIILKTLESLL